MPRAQKVSQKGAKVSQNAVQNRPRWSSGRDFLFFWISMPLSAIIGVFMVPGRQKSLKNLTKTRYKQHPAKNTLQEDTFWRKIRFFRENDPKRGPRTVGHELRFSSFFHLWTPKGAPGAPKGAPGSPKGATGPHFLSFVNVFGLSWAIFFEVFL